MNEDMIRELQKCRSAEEVSKFISDNKNELTPEQMEAISGGTCEEEKDFNDYEELCPSRESGNCDYEYTGKTRPGKVFGNLWLDHEMKCKYCGRIKWNIWGF